jgi:hypothetical protein
VKTQRPCIGTEGQCRDRVSVGQERFVGTERQCTAGETVKTMKQCTDYRVAAIFPERFHSFTEALKNNIFLLILFRKQSQLVAEA